ncbi:MAG: alpha/beta fold hydrolase [Anaerolineales bacterium]
MQTQYAMKKIFLTLILTLAACAPQTPAAPTALPTLTATPFSPPANAQTESPLTATPTVSAADTPYWAYTIEYLRSRPYPHPDDDGQIEITATHAELDAFRRVLIRYPSDGLSITGFMNIPNGEGPFPVVIMLHGYAPPEEYLSVNEDYTLPAADMFAQNGYLVIHPDMRGFSGNDAAFDNLFQTGLAIDVLNLIALVKAQGGQPGPLEKADPTRIGLWGHSLGGGVALRVITVSRDVRAAILYAAMSGDERKNSPLMFELTGDETLYNREQAVDAQTLELISPIHHFDGITAAVKLYHGTEDSAVPVAWAVENCDVLKLHLPPERIDCVYYVGGKHTIFSRFQPEFNNSQLAFLQKFLAP